MAFYLKFFRLINTNCVRRRQAKRRAEWHLAIPRPSAKGIESKSEIVCMPGMFVLCVFESMRALVNVNGQWPGLTMDTHKKNKKRTRSRETAQRRVGRNSKKQNNGPFLIATYNLHYGRNKCLYILCFIYILRAQAKSIVVCPADAPVPHRVSALLNKLLCECIF